MADTKSTIKQYRHLSFLAMLYAVILLTASCLTHKFINIDNHLLCAGSIVMPFFFVISDLITEVYGYAEARKILWNLIIIDFFIYGAFQIFALVQSHQGFANHAYYYVFGSMMRVFCAVWFSMLFSGFLNTYAIAKLKIKMHSRFFWLRSVLASGLGEVLYTTVGFIGILGGVVSNHALLWMILWGCFLKITITMIVAIPATLAAYLLKKSEGINPYDTQVNFNPFKYNT
jgi:queuosine precursor transporter